MDAARAAESAVMRGDELGPLHGVPIPIKDTEAVAGMPHTIGSLLYKDRIADADSLPAERIKGAGAIVVGKTNLPEFGHAGFTENRLGPPCCNPWNLEPHARRIERRIGGWCCGRGIPRWAWRRRRRFDTHPGLIQRPLRDKGHAGTHASQTGGRCLLSPDQPLLRRSDHTRRSGLCRDDERDGRSCPRRRVSDVAGKPARLYRGAGQGGKGTQDRVEPRHWRRRR